MEKINIIKAVPNFPFLESTIDGLSYYQLLAGLNNYINSVVDTMNKLQSELDSIGGNKDIIDKIRNDITEIKTDIDNINNIISIIGSSPLTTDSKELTSAINEINGNVLSIESTIGNDNIETTSKTLIGAINELVNEIADNQQNIGNLTDLTTTNKESLIKAINEVNAKPSGSVIGYITMTINDINISPNSYYTVDNFNRNIPENKSFLFALLETYSDPSSGDIELYNSSTKLYLRSVNGCTFSKLFIRLFYQ